MLDERMEDYFEITVKSILKSLSEANNTNNTNNTEIYYYGSKVKYGFNFNKGATDTELRNFETKIGYTIPSDYKEFLQYTNGLEFQNDDAKILDIKEILECYEIFDYPEHMIIIATSLSSQLHIAINLLSSENDNNIYVVYPIADDYFISIKSNFTEFLNRFLSCYGSDYWNWGLDTSDKVLKIEE